MGTGSSVRFKVPGESKEFHGTLVSGSSDSVEVHVHDDFSPFINVMFICNEWGSSKGGLSTFNREFAVNLAKVSSDKIKVHCYVCESSEEDREDARKQEVNLITARRLPGSNDPMEWLKMPPPELPNPDIVVGHGRKFGGAAHFISDIAKCRWVQFVHVFCEALGKHKLEDSNTPDAIAANEEKHKQELELCKSADLAVAVGCQLQRKYSRSLPDIKAITPGIFEKLVIPNQPDQTGKLKKSRPANAEEFSIFMFGRGSFEDFALKGYDIIGKAVALLGRKFQLTFVGSPQGKHRIIETWFREETNIARNQLIIRGYCDYEEMKNMLREADVIVMPSRTEGFGLVALEAISAGVPVLVSSEAGISESLRSVEGGMSVVVDSEVPKDWADGIQRLSELKPEERHVRAMQLREQYGKMYSWKKECERFKEMIHELVQRPRKAVPLNVSLTDQDGRMTMRLKAVLSLDDKRTQMNEEGVLLTDSEKNTSSQMSSEHTEDSSKKGRQLETDSEKNISTQTSSKHTEASSKKGGQLKTGSKKNNERDSLHFAARDGDVTKIESLLALGFSIDSRDDGGKTPLMIAAGNDKLQAVQCLLAKGADPSLQNNNGWNLLHHASQGGNPVIIELMLSHVPSIDSRNNSGATALMLAAASGKLQAVQWLMAKGADPSLQNNNGWNLLHHASHGGNTDIIELMLSRVPSIDSRNNSGATALIVAACNDKLQAVQCLLEKGADPSLQDNDGWNSLHHASQGDNPVIIELMLSHVHSIDSRNNEGSTALMIAAGNDKLQAVQCLLAKGADPSLQDNNGLNLLHHASQGGNPVIIELMLSHVPSIDSRNNRGTTALRFAALNDKLQAVQCLLAKSADPSLQNNDGLNSLHYASLGGSTAVIEKILSYGVDIESRTKYGSTPLIIAQKKGNTEAVTYLLSKGAKPSKQ